jgi:hypothetical protein
MFRLLAILIIFGIPAISAGDCYIDPDVIGYSLPIDDCPKHFFCPETIANNKTTKPQVCPASIDCQIRRLSSAPCLVCTFRADQLI